MIKGLQLAYGHLLDSEKHVDFDKFEGFAQGYMTATLKHYHKIGINLDKNFEYIYYLREEAQKMWNMSRKTEMDQEIIFGALNILIGYVEYLDMIGETYES